ncbi:MAG: hypothetical protein K2H14_04610 [Muribaculaceae bacterium]|nr:hypothetical protein [Muribaculaceae bacterium]
MRSSFLTIPVLASVVMLASCDSNNPKEQQTLMETSKQELALAVQERDQLLALVKEISADIDQIKNMDDITALTISRSGKNTGQRNQILKDIEAMRQTMLGRKARLAEVEQELANSTLNNQELTEIINAFRKQIDSQLSKIETLKQQLLSANMHIAALSNEVDSLNTTVTNVTNELDTAKQASLLLENRLNTCYYIVASKAELKSHNIIESGFLRKTQLMKGDFDRGHFTISDKRLLNTIPLKSPKARLLTNHPETSYELTVENGNRILTITDPERFWSLSNYLVVQTD